MLKKTVTATALAGAVITLAGSPTLANVTFNAGRGVEAAAGKAVKPVHYRHYRGGHYHGGYAAHRDWAGHVWGWGARGWGAWRGISVPGL